MDIWAVYLPALDLYIVRGDVSPLLFDRLLACDGAQPNPPHREGGYRAADEAQIRALNCVALGPPARIRY